MGNYKEEDLKKLQEDDFLKYGELDPEFPHIIHYDYRVFDFITKKIGMLKDADEFCDDHNHVNLNLNMHDIINNIKSLMKERGNEDGI
jgi:hypothetical protein